MSHGIFVKGRYVTIDNPYEYLLQCNHFKQWIKDNIQDELRNPFDPPALIIAVNEYLNRYQFSKCHGDV